MDPKQLRQIIKEEVTVVVQTELGSVKNSISALETRVNKSIGKLEASVKEINENVDGARGDIELLHMDVKGIRDKDGMYHSRNKREIDEIKSHLGMPLMSDVPAI